MMFDGKEQGRDPDLHESEGIHPSIVAFLHTENQAIVRAGRDSKRHVSPLNGRRAKSE